MSGNETIGGRASDKNGLVMPVGAIMAYGTDNIPSGWLLCDGSSLSRSGTYADLFAVIGTNFGAADGTHFNIPDLRGRFLRGRANGSTNDPDRGSRSAMNSGGNTNDNVGSVQTEQFAAHSHAAPRGDRAWDPGSGNTWWGGGTGHNTGSNGGSETHPVNIYVEYMIKY